MTARRTAAAGLRSMPPRRTGFTLVEMIVVVALIVLLVTLVVPAVNRMLEDRKLSQADNIVTGQLKSARPRALLAERGETGMFFMVDDQGVQRVFPIEHELNPKYRDGTPIDTLVAENRFVITEDAASSLPAPIRAVPRYAVQPDQSGPEDDLVTFSDDELANESFPDCPACTPAPSEAQRNRNYFTMLFSDDGRLSVWRNPVIIVDLDADQDGFGDKTQLPVSPSSTQYFALDATTRDIDPTGAGRNLEDVVTLDGTDGGIALNFPSVDALLVYDDSDFRSFETAEDKRDYLVRAAQPFYVNRLSGAVMRGPIGENVSEVP